jgi:hypothetical protein
MDLERYLKAFRQFDPAGEITKGTAGILVHLLRSSIDSGS